MDTIQTKLGPLLFLDGNPSVILDLALQRDSLFESLTEYCKVLSLSPAGQLSNHRFRQFVLHIHVRRFWPNASRDRNVPAPSGLLSPKGIPECLKR